MICFAAVSIVKERFNLDDSLDVFAVHGVGGILGTLLAAIFAVEALGGGGLGEGGTVGGQLLVQATGIVATVVWSGVVSFLIVKLTGAVCGLRASDDEMVVGLDISHHGERDYNL